MRRSIEAEDLRRFAYLSDPRISPDGATVAFVRKRANSRDGYDTGIWTVSTRGAARPLTRGPKDSSPRWIPHSQSLLFVRSHPKRPSQLALARRTPSGGASIRTLTRLPEGAIGAVEVSPDGRFAAYSFRATHKDRTKAAEAARRKSGASAPPLVIDDPWYRLDGDGYFGGDRFVLRILDLRTGRDRLAYDGDAMGSFSFGISPDSSRIALCTNRHPRALFEPWRTEVLILDVASGKFRALRGLPLGPKANPRFSPDGRTLAWAGRRGRDGLYSTQNLELFAHDLRSGRTRSLTGRSDFCLMAASLSDSADAAFSANFAFMPDGESILARLGWHGEGHLASIGVRDGSIAFHTFGAAEHEFGSLSADGRTAAILRSTPTELPEVFLASVEGAEFPLRQLTNLNRAILAKLDLAVPQSRWIRASDGASVQAWVLRPPATARRRLRLKPDARTPVVLMVHGGPHAQYGSAFFHEFQLLAAQGWTVVYGNPRGSKGYGRDHCAAIQGAWGTKDWIDVEATARWIARQPWALRERIGIEGGSYGGYMANWAVTQTRMFRAAITDRCVSNLVSMCGSSDFPEVPDDYWPGSAFKDPEAMWRASPIAHFHRARTPMLIIHSEGDLRCNIEQGEQVHAALAVQGVPVRFIRYGRNTSHGMSRVGPPSQRLHRLHAILDWWHCHLASPTRRG